MKLQAIEERHREVMVASGAIIGRAEDEDRDLTSDEQRETADLLDEAEELKAAKGAWSNHRGPRYARDQEAAREAELEWAAMTAASKTISARCTREGRAATAGEKKRKAGYDATARARDEYLRSVPLELPPPVQIMSTAEMRSARRTPMETRNPVDAGFREDIQKNYSLSRALLAPLNPGAAGFELEVDRELRGRMNRAPRGNLMVPWEALLPPGTEQRSLTQAGSAGAIVPTALHPEAFIEVLRNEAKVVQAGARVLTGLIGTVDIPKQTGTATAQWLIGDTGSVTPTDATFAKVTLTPKTVAVRSHIGRRVLLSGLPSAEAIVRQDIASVIGVAVDQAAINGDTAGTGGLQPNGVLYQSGVGTFTGATLTHAEMLEAEQDLGTANALKGRLAWMTRSSVVTLLKSREEVATSGQGFLMKADRTLNGYPVFVTQQVPASTLIFGNWEELLIGQWGSLDIFADPYTDGNLGGLVIRGFLDVDIAVRHGASFTFAGDVS